MKPVEFFFDYASPFAYLTSQVIEKRLEGIEIVYKPIYLRGLEMFAKGLPYTARKSMYVVRDYLRCADHEGVPTRIPSVFPINGLPAVRGALVAQELGSFASYHHNMFRAAFHDDRDISRKEVVLEVARGVSIELEPRIDSPEIKEKLRAQTADAEARGAFGVPAFFVDGELFWGHDRLDYVERAARR